MDGKRNDVLQSLCRGYLGRLRYIADKHGLGEFVGRMIKENREDKCSATEKEVRMLSRLCNDERLARNEVPKVVGKSYRQCVTDGDFERIRKLPHVGIYSKVSALLRKKS